MSNIEYVTGFRKDLIEKISAVWFYLVALNEYRSLKKTYHTMRSLNRLKLQVAGQEQIRRMVKMNGKYYWNMHLPGFPGKALNAHLRGEMNRIEPIRSDYNRLSILFLTVTKRCQLACKHCYAWNELSNTDTLPIERMIEIGEAFIRSGVSHIHLGGGEPMMRYPEMLQLINRLHKDADIWMATNGFDLSEAHAHELKRAGLKGVAISVDHFDADLHNSFRGHPESFKRAMQSTINCQTAGLVTCWSLCVRREFLSLENLFRYAELARMMKVTWIQLFEAMPSGRYAGKDVILTTDEKKIIERFYYEINSSSKYNDYPMVEYIGIYQQKIGCLGAGNRYVYVDTDGNLQPCPFCLTKEKISVDTEDIEGCLGKVLKEGCKVMSDE